MSKKGLDLPLEVLVTGGAGFIGSALTQLLLKKGLRVTVLDNLSFGRGEHIWPEIRLIRGDLRSEESLIRAIDRPYAMVFHLAAIHFIPYCNSNPQETISINVSGTYELLKALSHTKPKKLFFASTAAVYDTTSRYHREADLPLPMDIYGITKLSGEHLVRQFHKATGVPCQIGRLFNAYGPRETNSHLVPHILEQLKMGTRTLALGNLTPVRNYIHTSDMVDAIYSLTSRLRKGIEVTNIASEDEYSVRGVVSIFSKILKEKISIKVRHDLTRKVERSHLRADLKLLRKRARLKPRITFEEGIRELLEELKISKNHSS